MTTKNRPSNNIEQYAKELINAIGDDWSNKDREILVHDSLKIVSKIIVEIYKSKNKKKKMPSSFEKYVEIVANFEDFDDIDLHNLVDRLISFEDSSDYGDSEYDDEDFYELISDVLSFADKVLKIENAKKQ